MIKHKSTSGRSSTVIVCAAALLSAAVDAHAQFEPTLEWQDLAGVNAYEQTSLPAYELNTQLSRLQLTGALYTNHPASYWLTIDSTRGVAYWPQLQAGNWFPFYGGTIAVIDLTTLQVLRRLSVHDGGEPLAPTAVVHDPVGNRLFVSDWYQRKVAIVDAASGETVHVRTFSHVAMAMLYSHTTNCLIIYNLDAGAHPAPVFAWNLGDLLSEPVPMQVPPLPVGNNIDSYPVSSDETKLYYVAYTSEVGTATVYAFDVDPGSDEFGHIVWTTSGSVGRTPGRNANVWAQPTLDPVKGRLYVPDLMQGRLRVFDARLTSHPELPSIPIGDFGAQPGEVSQAGTINPVVDPVTGLIYALVDVSKGFDDGTTTLKTTVVTIDAAAGIVARAPTPRSIEEAPGSGILLDPGTRRLMLTTGDFGRTLALYHDARSSELTTPPSNAPITVSGMEASLTFTSVSTGGITTVASLTVNQLPSSLPGAFSLGGALLYEVSTTASFSGSVLLCFSAGHVESPAAFDSLRVLHFESGSWLDRTASLDYASRTVCATVDSLSPFAVARLTSPSYTPRLLYSTDRSFKSNATAPLKLQVLDWRGNNISSPDLALTVAAIRRTSDEAAFTVDDSGHANPDSAFRYDAGLEGYVFNLNTRGLASGSYSLTVDVGGHGRFIQLPFAIR